ncbi:MAG TPA: TIGR03435 family protein [Acidobacteriaceae bacterium]
MRLSRALLTPLACGLLSLGFNTDAQGPAAASSQPRFEAASVRMVAPYTDEEIQAGLGNKPWSTFPSNRFTAHRLTLKLLIGLSYDVQPDDIHGDPGWLDSQHYDIEAKVEGEQQLTYAQMQPLLQQLLKDRFHLAVHSGTRLTSGYALVVVDKQPPKLHIHSLGDPSYAYLLRDGLDAKDRSIRDFASLIAHPAGGPVIDKTNLQGVYDFKLSYDATGDPKSNLPSVFTAVQEQLGLKLVPLKQPVSTLIIDHVERIPTEN